MSKKPNHYKERRQFYKAGSIYKADVDLYPLSTIGTNQNICCIIKVVEQLYHLLNSVDIL